MTTSIEVTKPLNLSIDETAGALGVGRSTVYGLLRKGELHAIRIGDRQLVPIVEIERFIAARLATA